MVHEDNTGVPANGGGGSAATHDVIVVGNGVLGLSLALTLTRRGSRVAVVGEAARPWAASTAAGAMLGCFGEVTSTLLASSGGRAKLDLAVTAAGRWPAWLAELADDAAGPQGAKDGAGIRVADGTFVMLNAIGVPGIDSANYAAIRTALASYDRKYEDVEPADVPWIAPDAAGRPFAAMYLPDEHAVDSGLLLRRLESALLNRGGTLVGELATRVLQRNDRVTGVTLASGSTLHADTVVLAAGTRTQDLIDTVPQLAGRTPGLVAGFGVSALLDAPGRQGPSSVIRTPNRAFACGLHLVPRSAGEVYVGATNIISPTAVDKPVVRDAQFLLDCAVKQLHRDLWSSPVRRLQVGNRPVSLDGYPLIGEAGPDGLWLLTGTYRDGLHLSPLLAEEIARRLHGETPQLDLSLFTPVRPPVQPMTRRDTVETAVTHMLATGYEHDWRLPVDWPRTIEHSLRLEFRAFADEIHPTFTPPPEILAAARYSPAITRTLRAYYAAYAATD
ncbi:FAD-binding oxidoreductase [Streptomyces actinomycinicus]|uniref:FAD-binding oxidoreductase n=1 Tax=Streptomyces actinomycinicus TaxID=1695166 RepID=A0A937JP81_9ACTN|nr:FAD-dependent oxidoreductase [Streptomyces actinomycinicus]MBL1086544.1 FAD-binding oxidoreductase [Streptomyces actinomycinicus]